MRDPPIHAMSRPKLGLSFLPGKMSLHTGAGTYLCSLSGMLEHCTSARMAFMLLKTNIEFNVILHVIYIRRYYPASSLGSLEKEITIMIMT